MVVEFKEGRPTKLPTIDDLSRELTFEGVLDGKYDITGEIVPLAKFLQGFYSDDINFEIRESRQKGLTVVTICSDTEDVLYVPRRNNYSGDVQYPKVLLEGNYAVQIHVENPEGVVTEIDGRPVAPLYLTLRTPYGRFYNPGILFRDGLEDTLCHEGDLWFPVDGQVSHHIDYSIVSVHETQINDTELTFRKMPIEEALMEQQFQLV